MDIIIQCICCGEDTKLSEATPGAEVPCPNCGHTCHAPRAMLPPGSQLAGFRIEKVLGTGGMGDIFLATQLSMDRLVALKVLPRSVRDADTGSVDHFLHEMRLTARFEHPNIVSVFEAGEEGGLYYLAMSYVDGQDLDIVLQREARLAEGRALDIAEQVAGALAYAWERGQILHRDIKPSNIMLTRGGEVKVLDLGIAKSLSDQDASQTRIGEVMGTPYYMSPEQALGRRSLDCRSDMYSLGATLFHLLTGTPPFDAETPMAIMVCHVKSPVPSARERQPTISAACDRFVQRLIAKPREERFADWPAFLAALPRVRAAAQQESAAADAGPKRQRPAQKGRPRIRPKVKSPRHIRRPTPAAYAQHPAAPAPRHRPVAAIVVMLVLLIALAGILINSARPPHAPTISPGPTAHAETEAQRRAAAFREQLTAIRRDAAARPETLDATLERLQALQTTAPDSQLRQLVAAEIQRQRQLYRDRIAAVLDTLTREAEALARAGNLSGAAAVYELYRGALAEQTQSQREALAAPLHQQALNQRREADRKFVAGWFERLVGQLLAGDVAELPAALTRLEAAVEKTSLAPADQEQLRELQRLRATVHGLLERLAGAAGGGERKLPLQGGATRCRVIALADGIVRAECYQDNTWQARDLGFADMAAAARRAALKQMPADASTLTLRAVMSIETGQPEQAAADLAAAGSPLALLLRTRLRSRLADQALDRLLGSLSITRDALVGGKMPPRPATLGADKVTAATEEAKGLAAAYGDTEAGRLAAALRAGLEVWQARPTAAGPDEPVGPEKTPLERFLADLAKRNPAYVPGSDRQFAVQRNEAGDVVKLALGIAGVNELPPLAPVFPRLSVLYLRGGADDDNARIPTRAPLRDLGALAGLPLETLACEDLSVADLSPLAGLPLRALLLNGTLVRNLAPVSGSHIEVLELSRAPVTSLAAVADLPLRRLVLDYTAVEDLSPLRGMGKSLTQLSCVKAPVSTLEGLNGLPLRSLDVSYCNVTDLGPLAGMPLKRLLLARCPIASFAALSGLPLEYLDLSHTGFDRPSLLRDLPLTSLLLCGCPIESLDRVPLAGLKLLDISETKVRRLEPLAAAPELQYLDISSTTVRDLQPLSGTSLQSLIAGKTEIEDLTPLVDLPLRVLDLTATAVRDLTPLARMSVAKLSISTTRITDLKPLQTTPLQELDFSGYIPRRDDPILSRIQTFTRLNRQRYAPGR